MVEIETAAETTTNTVVSGAFNCRVLLLPNKNYCSSVTKYECFCFRVLPKKFCNNSWQTHGEAVQQSVDTIGGAIV